MAFADIENLLHAHMGLHSATVGSSTVAKAIKQRMRECNIDSVDDYHELLQCSATEFNALVDTVIIPETWFYRDRHPFVAFSDWLNTEWPARANGMMASGNAAFLPNE